MLGLSKYLTAGALAVGLSAVGWGGWQQIRAERAEAAASVATDRAAAAIQDLAQCRADSEMRGVIDNAVEAVGRLDAGAVTDWLRGRAAQAD